MEIEEKFIDTKRGKICYLEIGEGDKTIIFLHGGMGTPIFCADIILDLVASGYKIISPYLPGHGKSFDLPKNFTYFDYVDTMCAFIKAIKLKSPHIVGSSLGGAIVIGLTDQNLKAKKFLALSPVVSGQSLNLFTTIKSIIIDAFKDKAVRKLLRRKFYGYKVQTTPIWKLPKIWHATKTVNINKLGMLPKNLSVVWGSNDSVLPYSSQAKILQKKLKNKIEIVPGGHSWQIKSKEVFYKQVLKCLEE